MPAEYLICRDPALRHDWDVLDNFVLRKPSRPGDLHELTRRSRCTRCTTERIEFFSHVGQGGRLAKLPGRSRYSYPPEYSQPLDVDLGPVSASDVYSEMYRRAKPRSKSAKVVPIRAAAPA